MLITSPERLADFGEKKRVWQGIPTIERTKNGRLFAAWYSGKTKETRGNYCIVYQSDDDGITWQGPVAAAYKSEFYRCYDQTLWIDPLGRLWFLWAIMPENAVYASICDNPDADILEWSEEFFVGNDVMMNKPTVLSTGEWLFPISVWDKSLGIAGMHTPQKKTGAFVYSTTDNGKSFTRLGAPYITSRSYDEHMTIELNDGSLMMLSRTAYGISKSFSYDSGKTWTDAVDSNIGGPCSRFHIKRLDSGRVLLVNHKDFKGRNNLTALLSEDDCKTWKYSLLLDERDNVSYPDVALSEDGFIYIIYDRDRGGLLKSFEETKKHAREVLLAKITEEDIINGSLVNPQSRLKGIISKLDDFDGDAQAMYSEIQSYASADIGDLLVSNDDEKALEILFDLYSVNCCNMNQIDVSKLNCAIDKLKTGRLSRETAFEMINSVLRGVKDAKPEQPQPIVWYAMDYINNNYVQDFCSADIAEKLGVSVYYLCHVFKKKTGLTLVEYRDARRMAMAKRMLCHTDKSVTEIAGDCGYFDCNYFIRKFGKSEGMSPTKYRKLNTPKG